MEKLSFYAKNDVDPCILEAAAKCVCFGCLCAPNCASLLFRRHQDHHFISYIVYIRCNDGIKLQLDLTTYAFVRLLAVYTSLHKLSWWRWCFWCIIQNATIFFTFDLNNSISPSLNLSSSFLVPLHNAHSCFGYRFHHSELSSTFDLSLNLSLSHIRTLWFPFSGIYCATALLPSSACTIHLKSLSVFAIFTIYFNLLFFACLQHFQRFTYILCVRVRVALHFPLSSLSQSVYFFVAVVAIFGGV